MFTLLQHFDISAVYLLHDYTVGDGIWEK